MKQHFEYDATITRVVDGDTYECTIDLGFRTKIEKVRLRLRGVDTPETWRPRNDAEADQGQRATEFVERIVEVNPQVRVVTFKHGPSSFARYEADVFCRDEQGNELSLADALREAGFEKQSDY